MPYGMLSLFTLLDSCVLNWFIDFVLGTFELYLKYICIAIYVDIEGITALVGCVGDIVDVVGNYGI